MHMLPLSRPFITQLYCALTAAQEARRANAREAPPGFAATRRFRAGALMLRRILHQDDALEGLGTPAQSDLRSDMRSDLRWF